MGSVLCAHREVIEHALRWRKMVGGGMRQIGILAAAGLFALENNVQRLQQDHELADMLAEKLMQVGGVEVIGGRAHTNMVFFSLPNHDYDKFVHYTRDHGLLLGGRDPVRLVTHKDVSKEDIKRAVAIISGFFH